MFAHSEFLTNLNTHLKLAVLLYADDTIILSDSPEGLQNGLNALKKYCDLWHLKVNESKTKIVIFSRGKPKKAPPKFAYGDSFLEIVDEYKYLGVIFNYNGTFKKSQTDLIKKAKKAMFSLIRHSRKLNLSIETQLELFDSMITPILCYGCEVTGFEDLNEIEKVQKMFCKYILKVRQGTPTVMTYGELGRFPVEIALKSRMVTYFCKLKNENEKKWNFILFKILQELHENEYLESNWLKKIKSIYDNCGFTDLYAIDKPNPNHLKFLIKRRLKDQYLQYWSTNIREDPRCSSYKNIKVEFRFEKYIDLLPRKVVINFRLSNIYLTGVNNRIYNKPSLNETCPLCNQEARLDEIHFIMSCNYQEIVDNRQRLFKSNQNLDNIMKINPSTNLNTILFLHNLHKLLKSKVIKFPKCVKRRKSKSAKTVPGDGIELIM